MILPIYTEPNPILHQTAQPVEVFTPELEQLVANMRETMKNAKGIGLAAPQVGQSIALCVIEMEEDEDGDALPFLAVFNPRITWRSTRQANFVEGCLSLPGIEGTVRRPERIRVKAKDLQGQPIQIEADGLLARVLQHEIDHLSGTLFVSYLQKNKLHQKDIPDYPRI